MPNYPWPGNFRELEQCARNVLIRGEYHPVDNARHREFDSIEDAVRALAKRGLSADELLRVYCEVVYEQEGGQYEATAKCTGLNWRTVKKHVLAAATTNEHSSRSRPPRKPR